ncbi:MAG TPA: hypothetical protein VGK58_20510 [Lacipirellulaceae bacterium]
MAAFPLRAEPHARLDRLLGQAREVGPVRAVGRAQSVDRAKAAAKRLRDLQEVVHPLRRVQHALRETQRVKALRPDSVRLLAAVQRLVS